MAEYYSRREMSSNDERIRDDEHLYISRVRDEGRSNAEECRTLSRSDDQGLAVRNSGTLSRFQWDYLFDGSRGGSRSNIVNEDIQSNGVARRGPNYDRAVERSVPIVSEGIRNVTAYDPNVDGSRYIGRSRNVARVPVEDDRNYSVREREYPQRQSVDEVNGHIGRTRNVIRLPVEDGRNYSVREREYPQRQSYDEEDGLMFRSEDGSHSLTPRSQSSGQRTPSRGISRESLPQEGQYRSVDGIGSSSRIPPTRLSSYYRTRSTEDVSPRARGEYAPIVHRPDGYVHPESHRSRDYSLTAVSEDNYDDDHHRVQGYNDRGSYGIDVVNVMLPRDQYVGNSRRDAVMEEGYSGLHDISRPIQEAPTLDNYDGSRTGYEFVYGEINIGPRNSYPDYRTEEIRQSLPLDEQFTYERNTRDMSYEQHVYGVRQNEEIPTMLENSMRIMDVGDFSSPEQPNTLKRRLLFANETSETSGSKRIANAVRGASSYDERHLVAEDEHGLRLSNRISHERGESHSRDHTGVSIAEARQPSNGLRKSRQKPLSKPDECSKGDVMKRKFPPAVSRPCAPQLSWPKEAKRFKTPPHVTNTLSSVKIYGKAKGTDFKKKLKSVPKPVACPSTATDVVVLQSGPNANKQQKHAIKDFGSMNGDLRSQDVDADRTVLKVKPLNDLPEDSAKFKQSVVEWFFTCMVHLTENISYQKKFKRLGIGCRLKCVICSSVKEFRETKDVAAHAFSSLKVGYKAQHSGFHRALCVLMGWDSAAAANGRWICQSLPEPMAWTLREDVIIWPPVVIIQNFPAGNCQLNEIGNVSIELKNILKDKGFREIKAVHEKPGNPNFMVVEFVGIVPGLKEAERLHNSFAENKHGRAELAQLDAEVVYCKVADKKSEDTRKLLDKSEDDQYRVNKKEDDQELLDRIKDEQSVVKTEDYQKPIDKREDENEHMKIDQQLVDKAIDDQEPIGRDQDDLGSVDKAQDDQEPIGRDQDDLGSVDKARDDQVPLENGQGDQELVEEAEGEQKPVHKSLGDQELVEEAQVEQNPVDKSQGDQEQVNKTSDTQGLTDNRRDDEEPLDNTGDDQELVGLADNSKDDQELVGLAGNSKDDQELVEEAQGEQILVGKSKGEQEQANKTSDTQGLTDNRKDDQEPLDKTGYDQVHVGLANNSKNDQEPLDKTTYDQEPAGQKGDDKEPVGKKYNTLYGYLGIVEDFPRLPDDMKRHHLARSKEEIFASYNALI